MGDVGDYWNAHREFKRDARRLWVECDSPGCQFGGNPVKVAPGDKCRHCGVRAPGRPGSDVDHARDRTVERKVEEEELEAKRRRRQAECTCRSCGKHFKTPQGRAQHERDAHQSAAKASRGN